MEVDGLYHWVQKEKRREKKKVREQLRDMK